MLATTQRALEHPISVDQISASCSLSANRFAFMFDRFLLAMGFLPVSHIRKMQALIPQSVKLVALSLPETIDRRRVFESSRPKDCAIFDGVRRRPGWIGCGLSYMLLAQQALQQSKNHLMVMEDDVVLPEDFDDKLAIIQSYLDSRSGQWDVFSGVIASLHDEAEILSIETYCGMTFITINKMTSTVFNIYSQKAMQILVSWNPMNLDAAKNTIDRYLESQTDLKVVVTLPFFVGHREEVHSTLWGFKNVQYNEMIANSEQKLHNMALLWNKNNGVSE